MNIFVAKLNYSTTAEALEDLFSEYGTVVSSKVIMDRETGRSKGYGFIEMSSEDEGNAAISALNDTDFEGNTIVVKQSEPQRRERRNFQPRNRW